MMNSTTNTAKLPEAPTVEVTTTTTASSPQQGSPSAAAPASCGVEAKQGTAPVVTLGKKRSLEETTTVTTAVDEKVTSVSPDDASPNNKRAKMTVPTTATTAIKKTKKSKKKKFSNILQGMMSKSSSNKIQIEREALKKHLGGGNFQKVEKI